MGCSSRSFSSTASGHRFTSQPFHFSVFSSHELKPAATLSRLITHSKSSCLWLNHSPVGRRFTPLSPRHPPDSAVRPPPPLAVCTTTYLCSASVRWNPRRNPANRARKKMAIARTGVFVDDYLEYSSTLPAELQRLLNTIRELDERSQAMINQTRQQTKYCLGLASQGGSFSRKNEEEEVFEKLRKEIEANQDNALSLCTEKVLLARQAHDLIDSHIKRLDEDLNNFAEDLKQEGKIAPDEPAVLPPLPLVPKSEKRKSLYGTPQSKRLDYKDRDWDRERDRDFELMPPPGSLKKDFASPIELDQPIDPNEPTYCVCHQVSFGDMIACDNENCQGGEWFHYACVGLTPETRFKGKWYCPTCRQLPH